MEFTLKSAIFLNFFFFFFSCYRNVTFVVNRTSKNRSCKKNMDLTKEQVLC